MNTVEDQAAVESEADAHPFMGLRVGRNPIPDKPPRDGLHRLDAQGIPEVGEPRWIVDLKMYDQPAQRNSWDTDPPDDITTYDGPSDSMKRHAFDEKVSNTIPSDRDVPDTRNPVCKDAVYDVAALPTSSVIVCFHNEARSTLLRTVRSVIRRTPPELLVEIILVDDASEWPIPDDILAMEKIVGIRLNSREGLIRARTVGAQAARGDVLTFLDSHVEANEHWLEPLLQRISENYKNVVTPVIDLLDDKTFNYGASPLVVGSFNWALTFKWKSARGARGGARSPVMSPTMAGGLFSIHRRWFIELGTYDLGMDIWGGENLEISWRIWQCHGRLEIMPCSRVGHVFRKRHPYQFPGGAGNVFLKNSLRAGRVWMDDYIQHFYDTRGGAAQVAHVGLGDFSERVQLRNKLHCENFEWYLKEVIPDLKVPNNKKKAWGEVVSAASRQCMDSLGHMEGGAIGMYACHHQGGNQMWTLTEGHQLQHDNNCVDAFRRRDDAEVILRACSEEEMRSAAQSWDYDTETQLLFNAFADKCLAATASGNGFLVLKTCDPGDKHMQWTFSENAPAKK
eukprot:m.745773 g.745773  ORF g.745773 m.745773 type:complete len:566 (+) comp23128_c0_seq1:2-1699(+)